MAGVVEGYKDVAQLGTRYDSQECEATGDTGW